MAIGSRRFILQNGDVIDVSDPRAPKLVSTAPSAARSCRWRTTQARQVILVTGASSPITSTTAAAPWQVRRRSLIEKTKQGRACAASASDATIRRISSALGVLDRRRRPEAQGAGRLGTHRNYYDGGDYAYLDTRRHTSSTWRADPLARQRHHGGGRVRSANPKSRDVVVPGQRADEEAQYRAWREYGTRCRSPACTADVTCRKVETAASSLQRVRLLRHADHTLGHTQPEAHRAYPDYKYRRGTPSPFTHRPRAPGRGFVIANPRRSPTAYETSRGPGARGRWCERRWRYRACTCSPGKRPMSSGCVFREVVDQHAEGAVRV